MTRNEADSREVDLVIERGIVLPMTGENDLIWDGAVAIDGSRIVGLGTTEDLRRDYRAKRTINAHEHLLMPAPIPTTMKSRH